ncbi:MAG TPA: hypothetical protein VLU24_06645 [Mycobacterium sp.]|nr:hypothetical protein [Mycobacterium sp.]
MMLVPLFLCIGFMLAVLYIDLMFDVTAVPYRRTKEPLPGEVVEPIASYYRRITQNPYVLMFVMLTATVCIVAEIVYDLVPRWAGYVSLALMGAAMLAGAGKVIPAAQRLASGKDADDKRTRLVHSMLPGHVVLLISILLLALVQFSTSLK